MKRWAENVYRSSGDAASWGWNALMVAALAIVAIQQAVAGTLSVSLFLVFVALRVLALTARANGQA